MDSFFHDLTYSLAFSQLWLLLEKADRMAWGKDRFALKVRIDPGQNAQQGTFTRAVKAEHTDLGAVEVGQGDVLENWFLVVMLADANHRIDDLAAFVTHG